MTNLPNYLPVKNRYDFEYDIYKYYNQYYASSYVTQQRRIMRNYLSNQDTVKQNNRNPFINNQNKKFSFLYNYDQTYMIVQNKNNIINMFLLINNHWCPFKKFSNKNECNTFINFIKSHGLKNN